RLFGRQFGAGLTVGGLRLGLVDSRGSLLDLAGQRFHRLMVTVVPLRGSEMISNSSISRRTPDRPSPRPPEVEWPPAMARGTSAIPGPSSRATTTTPGLLAPFATPSQLSPRLASST